MRHKRAGGDLELVAGNHIHQLPFARHRWGLTIQRRLRPSKAKDPSTVENCVSHRNGMRGVIAARSNHGTHGDQVAWWQASHAAQSE